MGMLRRYELQGCAEQPFDTLSGGQQARFQILLLERSGATLLLLDEPTDNLDLVSAEALEAGLAQFTGTVDRRHPRPLVPARLRPLRRVRRRLLGHRPPRRARRLGPAEVQGFVGTLHIRVPNSGLDPNSAIPVDRGIEPGVCEADKEPPAMRTIGFRTNLLFIFAAAFGLLASLGRPGTRRRRCRRRKRSGSAKCKGPVEEYFTRLVREISTESGHDRVARVLEHGHDPDRARGGHGGQRARARWCPPSSSRREVLRLATLAMLGIVVVKLVNTPDAAGLVERRQGAWIALGVTGIMASSAQRGLRRAADPPQARPEPRRYPPHRAGAAVFHARVDRGPTGPRSTATSSGPRRRRAAGPGSQAGSR